jgi:serine protease AprX
MDSEVSEFINNLLGNFGPLNRPLQDSPILPEVWVKYAESPRSMLDLLITPCNNKKSIRVGKVIRDEIRASSDNNDGDIPMHGISTLESYVVANLYFHQTIGVLLTRTAWYRKIGLCELAQSESKSINGITIPQLVRFWTNYISKNSQILHNEKEEENVKNDDSNLFDIILSHRRTPNGDSETGKIHKHLELARFIYLIGFIGLLKNEEKPNNLNLETIFKERMDEIAENASKILPELEVDEDQEPVVKYQEPIIWQVAVNRKVQLALTSSVPSVKGDAARQLFNTDCSSFTWAVIDSGIDASHPAFIDHKSASKKSRVSRSLDFTSLRSITSLDVIETRSSREALSKTLSQQSPLDFEDINKILIELSNEIEAGKPYNWELIEPLIELPKFTEPQGDHGTHVAGIIGSDW